MASAQKALPPREVPELGTIEKGATETETLETVATIVEC